MINIDEVPTILNHHLKPLSIEDIYWKYALNLQQPSSHIKVQLHLAWIYYPP